MKVAVFCAALLAAAPAAAGPLADSLKRHSDRDVTTLREQRSEVGARCTLGAVYAKRKDLSRAHLYLRGCSEAPLPDEVAGEITKIAREVVRTVEDSDLSRLEIVTSEDEVVVAEITALPGDTFDTPATLYVKPGTYTVNAIKDGAVVTNQVIAEKRSRAMVILDTTPRKAPVKPPPKEKRIDFVEEHGSQTQQSGPPPDVKHKSILPDKFKQKPVVAATDPNALEDPMITRETVRAPRPFWLGLRLGGGVFDDGAAGARAGIAVAATTRYPLAGSLFFAGRVDYSRRGSGAIDTFGASAGAGYSMLGISVIGQLRGDLRFGDPERSSDQAERAGVTAAAAVEVALPRTPITAGLRFEQGLTAIVSGTRDRAVLVELGVDWR